MIREQYDKTNNFFNNEMKKYENKCNESNISIHYCYNSLMYKFQQYKNYKNKINLITRLDFKDKNKIKVLLNKANLQSKDAELRYAKECFDEIKNDLFSFLDKTKDPYFFILYPFYKFGSGINYTPIPYLKDNMSGVQNTEIASDYAMYKINCAI